MRLIKIYLVSWSYILNSHIGIIATAYVKKKKSLSVNISFSAFICLYKVTLIYYASYSLSYHLFLILTLENSLP